VTAAPGGQHETVLTPDAERALEILREADGPITYEELSAGGVRWPGDAVYELQLCGHPVDQAHGALRLGRTMAPGFAQAATG
jgi:hypothetical protein